MKKFYLSILVIIVLLFVAVPILTVDISEDNSVAVTGVVTHIFEGPSYDIVFQLENDDKMYYINRGIESGLSITELQDHLLGQETTFYYADHFIGSPLHITHLVTEEIFYSEW